MRDPFSQTRPEPQGSRPRATETAHAGPPPWEESNPTAMEEHEARRLDRFYGWQRHVYDWTRPLVLPGRDRLLEGLPAHPGACLLEVGCGTGRNLRWLRHRSRRLRLFGLDLSETMLRTARARSRGEDEGVGGITYLAGSATRVDLRAAFGVSGGFDGILFSYSLSMIPEWRLALARGVDALGPGGSVHIVDFGDFGEWVGPARRTARWWLRSCGVHPPEDLAAHLHTAGGDSLRVFEDSVLARGYARLVRARGHSARSD